MTTSFGRAIARWDQASLLAVERWRRGPITVLLKGATYSGTGKAWLAFSAALNILDRLGMQCVPEQKLFLRAMLCPLFAWAAGSILKKLVKRKRPADRLAGYTPLIPTPGCYSFPSSHASSSISFFAALVLTHHPLGAAVGIWAALVTFSRYYLGLHFLTDLLGGLALGALCGLLIVPINAWF